MTQKNSNNKFLIGIAVAFLLPLSLYLIVSKLSKGKIKIPHYYTIDRIDSPVVDGKVKPDTVYHQVGDLVLTNQMGERVSLNKDLAGKMVIIDFFFADCTATCPKLAKSMLVLQNCFKKDPKKESTLENDVQLVSITVLPERDSFQRLRAYADRIGANHDHWWFLTGDKKAIYAFARNELGIATGPGDGGADDFIHSDKLILLDKNRYIRGYYNGLNDSEGRKCSDDVVLLTLEKGRKKK